MSRLKLFVMFLACMLLPSQAALAIQNDKVVAIVNQRFAFAENPWAMVRLPRILITESARYLERQAANSFPLNTLRKQDVNDDPDDLYLKASQMVMDLENKSENKSLTRKDTKPVWEAIRHLHQSEADTYEQMLVLYHELNRLPLPAVDKLETIRLLGQDKFFRGDYDRATALFSSASDVSMDGLSTMDKEICSSKLGNIFYLNGLSLTKNGDEGASIEYFQKVVEDAEILNQVPPETRLNIYKRLGRLFFDKQEFEKAAASFIAGIQILEGTIDSQWDLEKEYRISLEIGRFKSEFMAVNPDSPDYKEMLAGLDALKEKFEKQGYPDFDAILKAKVLVANDQMASDKTIGDGDSDEDDPYLKAVEELRDYYKHKHSVTKSWGEFKDYFLDSSKLLIEYYIKQKDEEKAKEVLIETKELANPPERWFYRFPKELRNRAFEKSILDEDSEDNK